MKDPKHYVNFDHDPEQEEARPRVILWEMATNGALQEFSTSECLLTIDSIARTTKSIVVLTGAGVMGRPDLYQIVEYGVALGLKMIIEVRPPELSSDVLRQYKHFGQKIFRILLDGCIVEDMNTRYKQTPEFRDLEIAVRLMKNTGYELHFGGTITQPDARQLAFYHDYAFRHGASGLYCHLCFGDIDPDNGDQQYTAPINQCIQAIAKIKHLSPTQMYVSPQCVKYGFCRFADNNNFDPHTRFREKDTDWNHWCIAGKSFAYITKNGKVQMCSSMSLECGDLKENGYDFREIWESSDVFHSLRTVTQSCEEVRSRMQHSPIKENEL